MMIRGMRYIPPPIPMVPAMNPKNAPTMIIKDHFWKLDNWKVKLSSLMIYIRITMSNNVVNNIIWKKNSDTMMEPDR
jgi:hypothetical protein